jgi:aminoglycoside phosphotransferase (APT) family kinase protein
MSDLQHGLATHLTSALGETVVIERMQRITMGQSRAMYVLHATVGGTPRRMVARIEQSGLLGSDAVTEVPVMQALFRAGFPVAEVLVDEPTGDVLGQPFFVMDFVEGVSTDDDTTTDEYVALLHRLHTIDPTEIGLTFLPTPSLPTGPALALVGRWADTYRGASLGEPSPLMEEAIAKLVATAPPSERISIVHADPGPGNYLHAGGRVTALVDWEFAHLGDAYDDWAYLVFMRGKRVMTPDQWVRRIREVTGVDLDLERLAWWRGCCYLMSASIDLTALQLYERRVEVGPNLLAVGAGHHLGVLRRLYDAILA